MAFVVTDGQLAGLERVSAPTSAPSVQLADGISLDYGALWRTQPQVRTVVDFLARNIAQLGLHTYRRRSDDGRERLRDNPVTALVGKPNPWTTRYRMVDALVHDMAIWDNAFWLKVRALGQLQAVVRVPPWQVTPLGEAWFAAAGYRLKGNKGFRDVNADQVVHFRGYGVSDSRWGQSPIEALRRTLAEEWSASAYRDALWRNGARFSGYLRRPLDAPRWDETARSRFRAGWQGQYTGYGGQVGGTPVLEDGMEFVPAAVTPEAAQYLQSRKLTREEVASAYHIPLPMVGILEHATFSNILEQHKQLYQDTLGPWLTMIQDELALQLLGDLDGSGQVYVEFNLAEKLKGSFEEQATQLQTAVGAPWLTRNEARARQNLPAVDGGDDLVVPLNVLVGGQASATDSAPPASSRRVRGKARGGTGHEARLEKVFRGFFRRQGSVVRTALGVKADAEWWDGERWDSELAADLYAAAVRTSSTVATQVVADLGLDPDTFDADATLAFLAEFSRRTAGAVNAVTRAKVEAALAEDDPGEAVTGVFDVAQASRSAQLAVASVTALSGFATVEAGRQVGGTGATKTWVTGANPRPEHAAMNGESVPVGEPFSNGAMWPGDKTLGVDDTAGCNCSLDLSV